MAADSDEQAEGSGSARRTSQGGKRVPRASRSAMQLPPRGGQSLTASPAPSAVSFRSLAAAPNAGSPPDALPGSFWQLLLVSEGSRRNSAAAAGPAPSWIASTPESAETVKRSPLTPFPPWASGDEAEGERAPQGREPDPALRARRFVGRRWVLNTAVHGGVLFGQCIVTLAVLSVFVVVTVLWLEALMLTVTTATALGLSVCVLAQGAGQPVKGAVVGCVAMMMGTGMLAFFRAALVWWLEDCGELGGGGDDVVFEE